MLTQQEFGALSAYRQFCLVNHLTLSEHGLLLPPTWTVPPMILSSLPPGGVTGDFIIPMEMTLNRFKSGFQFSRHLYFEYLYPQDTDEIKEECHFWSYIMTRS